MSRRPDLGIPIDEASRRRAQVLLQRVWRDMVSQLVDSCVANADDIGGQGFSYSYQELEDRFGQRLFLASQMIGALQMAAPPRPDEPVEYRVERVEGALDELDVRINERLQELRGHIVHDVSIHPDDDDNWHAFLTISNA